MMEAAAAVAEPVLVVDGGGIMPATEADDVIVGNLTTTQAPSLDDLPEDMRFNDGHRISIVGYGTMFLVSSVANLRVLLLLKKRYDLKKARIDLLLIHLAIADLTVTFFLMPMEVGWAATVMWYGGDFLCRFMSFFRIFGLFLSSNILICISLNRFFAIIKPLSSCSSSKNLKIQLFIAWVVSILSSSPQPVIFHVAHHPNHTWYSQCVTFNSFPSPAAEYAYIIFGMVMVYFLPLIVIVVTYSIMLTKIYKKARTATGTSSTNGGGHGGGEGGCDGLRRSGIGYLDRAKAKTLKMTVVIVMVFILCWTPYYVIVVWFMVDKASFDGIDQKIQKTFFLFACLNSAMNPIVYGFFHLKRDNRQQDQQQLSVRLTSVRLQQNTSVRLNRSSTKAETTLASMRRHTTWRQRRDEPTGGGGIHRDVVVI